VSADDPSVFVTHVLKGKRFDGHTIPVEVLPELAAYRQLVVAVARELFFQDNPTRQRVPKGFEQGFQLVLRQIGEGSAAAALERVDGAQSGQQLRLLDDLFERSRDLISDAISTGENVLDRFPVSALHLFNEFGASLRDDERIEVVGPRGSRATYDRKTRKRLVLLRESTYEDDVDVVGRVVQYDGQRMVFEVVVNDRRVPGKLDELSEASTAVVRTALSGLFVRVVGRGAFDGADVLTKFTRIDELTYAEDEELKRDLDVEKRLKVLATLGPGWLDGQGEALTASGLEWLTEMLAAAIEQGIPRPYLYPTPEGGVLAEWPFSDAEVSVEFDLTNRIGFLVGTHLRSQALRESTIQFGDPLAIDQLVSFITCFGPEGMTGSHD
jgi:hypothetical protein